MHVSEARAIETTAQDNVGKSSLSAKDKMQWVSSFEKILSHHVDLALILCEPC